jgi:hypothetical protein
MAMLSTVGKEKNMKPFTKVLIACVVAIITALCGSLLLSFNILIPFAITLMVFGFIGTVSLAFLLLFIHCGCL